MITKQIIMVVIAGVVMEIKALGSVEVTNVRAQQRYPWNGLVDVAFTVTGDEGKRYDTSFVAKDVVGGTNLPMRTLMDANGTALSLTNSLAAGSYKWIWNAAVDLPNGFLCDRVAIEVNTIENYGLYMVVDLSGGATATKYPVSYLDAVPSGGWTDTYKTTKLVLRKIIAGTFKMQGNNNVTLTKPFYMGIYPVTQKQYQMIVGSVPSQNKWTIGDKHPVFFVSYLDIRGATNGNLWPSSNLVDNNTILGRLRSRTSFDFDLPTEAQWEYACRAGTTTGYYWGSSFDTNYLWCLDNSDTSQDVGMKLPNAWGLYDMSGNAWEFCLDWYGDLAYGIDPKGPSSNSSGRRVRRGGDYQTSDYDVFNNNTKYSRDYDGYSWSGDDDGFRLCITLD